MEIAFPIEFLVRGTPVTLQSRNLRAREQWKARIQDASLRVLPRPHFASSDRLAITIYYMPDEPMQGDLDNIVKLILDGMSRHVFVDDRQVERIVVQKFEPENIFRFASPTHAIVQAMDGDKPILYVRVSNDPFEDLK